MFLIDNFLESGGICETLHLMNDHSKSLNTGCSFTQYLSRQLFLFVTAVFLLIQGGVVANALGNGAANRF